MKTRTYKVNLSSDLKNGAKSSVSPQNLRAEVDRILDKINSQGFGALTDDEKQLLDQAKDMLNQR
ncbi:MAG: hypothetical protein J6386_06020 [Candidatus Synoicihabitans palmerolidicus]|nr:hypothetical protein [Candidatus Synoicihabitans palmerolidicus]